MKKFIIPILAISLLGAFGCSKDEESEPDPAPVPPPDASYVIGKYAPVDQLASIRQNNMTAVFNWDNDSTLKSLSMDDLQIAFTYDNLKRQTKVENGESLYKYTYKGNALSEIQYENVGQYGNIVLYKGNVTCSGNHITSINYTDINPIFANEILDEIIPSTRKDSQEMEINKFQTDYTWGNGDVNTEKTKLNYTLDGTVGSLFNNLDLESIDIDALLESLNLSIPISASAVKDMLREYVQYFGDSTCTASCSANITSAFTYDKCNNPIYGVWTDGFLQQTQILSMHNCTKNVTNGELTIEVRAKMPTSNIPSGVSLALRGIIALIQGSDYFKNGELQFSFTRQIPEIINNTTFTYDNQNRPTTMTQGGETITFQYR